MRALIVGYGRAGRRHAKILKSLISDIQIVVVDPFAVEDDASYMDIQSAFSLKCDFAVICTPPDQHLADIRACLNADIKYIMCEKPVCGLEQLKEAEKMQDVPVMIAYNYRYHSALELALKKEKQRGKTWQFYSDQQRVEWPSWGFLIDHLGHTFDILTALDEPACIESAIQLTHRADDGYKIGEALWVQGKTANGTKVEIADCVRKHFVQRAAWINGPFGYMDMSQPGKMFENMWISFLHSMVTRKRFAITIEDALPAQRMIEDTARVLVRKDTQWGTANSF